MKQGWGRPYRQREQQVQRHRGTKQPDVLEELPEVQNGGGGSREDEAREASVR